MGRKDLIYEGTLDCMPGLGVHRIFEQTVKHVLSSSFFFAPTLTAERANPGTTIGRNAPNLPAGASRISLPMDNIPGCTYTQD